MKYYVLLGVARYWLWVNANSRDLKFHCSWRNGQRETSPPWLINSSYWFVWKLGEKELGSLMTGTSGEEVCRWASCRRVFVSHVNTHQGYPMQRRLSNQMGKSSCPVDVSLSLATPVFGQWALIQRDNSSFYKMSSKVGLPLMKAALATICAESPNCHLQRQMPSIQ